MPNEFYFQCAVTPEQIAYAEQLVDYSIANYPVTDIFANDPQGAERQREFRLTGTLGEVVFADAYQLPRPTRSFGAIDGQDYGEDFILPLNGKLYSFDIKTMTRRNNRFYGDYVLNLPSYQVNNADSRTDYYFCVNLHGWNTPQMIASFLGYVPKEAIITGQVGQLFQQGTKRLRADGTSFTFQRDTYEVLFRDINTPPVTNFITQLNNFQQLTLR